MDLCDLDSVSALAESLDRLVEERLAAKAWPGVGRKARRRVVLVCNAGVNKSLLQTSTKLGRTADGFEEQFQGNYLGHYLLTRLLQKKGILKSVLHVTSYLYRLATLDVRRERDISGGPK